MECMFVFIVGGTVIAIALLGLQPIRKRECRTIIGKERIACPNCGVEQLATITHHKRTPWPSYVHECEGCKYVIGESEWEPVTHNDGDS